MFDAAKQASVTSIKSLKWRQWQAIAHALELKREQRLSNTNQFLKKFIEFSKTTRALIAALTLSTIGLGSIALYRPDIALKPDTPFIELLPKIQAKVTASLNGGNEALRFNNIDHTKTKAMSPQTNGICERFDKTILQAFIRSPSRRNFTAIWRSCKRSGRIGGLL